MSYIIRGTMKAHKVVFSKVGEEDRAAGIGGIERESIGKKNRIQHQALNVKDQKRKINKRRLARERKKGDESDSEDL